MSTEDLNQVLETKIPKEENIGKSFSCMWQQFISYDIPNHK